jgi:ABC-type multidrug transport system permease subunit
MRTAFIFLTIIALLLTFFLARSGIWFRRDSVDIHVHDTYIVFTYFAFIAFVFLLLGTFFSIGGTLGTGFKNKYFLWILFLFLALDGFLIWKYYNL